MQIIWSVHCYADPLILSQMQTAADLCLYMEGITEPCSVSVCLCDDDEIAHANSKYRNINHATDVLSFPTISYPIGLTAGSCAGLLRQEWEDDTGTCFLGDLMISVPHISIQAEEYGHSKLREAVYLLVHGICHLMGYDHIDINDKEKMRTMEEKILSAMSVTRDCSAASDDDTLLLLAREAMKRSYSPYSHYPVGAALRCTDGRIFQGCNIENASFGLTNCAERTALFKAVSEGAVSFDVLAIAAETRAWPCGACRQALNEFAPNLRVLITWDNHVEEMNLSELLPGSFGPRSMDR